MAPGKSRKASKREDSPPPSHSAIISEFEKFKSELRGDLMRTVSDAVRREFRNLEEKIEQQQLEIDSLKRIVRDNERDKLMSARMSLASNFVIRGISENRDEKKMELESKVEGVLKALDVHIPLKSVTRVGKQTENGPRIVKVVTEDINHRNAVLIRAKKLRNLPTFRNVYLDSDKCLLDRREDARLRKRMKLLKHDSPTSDIKIFKGLLLVDDVEVDRFDPLRDFFSN